MSSANPDLTARLVRDVEAFVRQVVIPYEKDPRRNAHGPLDSLVQELRE